MVAHADDALAPLLLRLPAWTVLARRLGLDDRSAAFDGRLATAARLGALARATILTGPAATSSTALTARTITALGALSALRAIAALGTLDALCLRRRLDAGPGTDIGLRSGRCGHVDGIGGGKCRNGLGES